MVPARRPVYDRTRIDLNCGLRDKELRELRWQQIDLVQQEDPHGRQVENSSGHWTPNTAE
jgi:integrase